MLCFNGPAALCSGVKNRDQVKPFFKRAHLSALGNAEIAHAFYQFLQEKKINILE
jgi:hypothetical protein